MDIPTHRLRFVQLAAYASYEDAVKSAKAKDDKLSLSTKQHDEVLVIIEHLKIAAGAIDPQQAMDLAGTPMGEQMTREYFTDDDGTSLEASPLLTWLEVTAGCYPPVDVIAAWGLDQRKMVAAWLRAIDKDEALAIASREEKGALSDNERAELHTHWQSQARVSAPQFVIAVWFTKPVEHPPAADLTDAEVEDWAERGPWGVKSYEAEGVAPGSEWVLVRVVDGVEVEESKTAYTAMGLARREAAIRNFQRAAEQEPPATNEADAPGCPARL